MVRAHRVVGARVVVWLIVVGLIATVPGAAIAQQPPRPDGWVVIAVEEYRALRARAFPPDQPPDPPPVEATLTRVEYDLRAGADAAAGEARLTVDVLKEGWVRVDVPPGLLVRTARVDGRTLPVIDAPAPHILLSKPGRVFIALDIVVPLKTGAGVQTLTLPPSRGAVSRLALVVPQPGIELAVGGGVLAERPPDQDGRWIAFGRAAQPLSVTWKRRAEARAALPLKWRGTVTEIVGLGEDASTVNATIAVEVTQGAASAIDVAVPDGVAINQVSGALVADWDARPGAPLRVTFLEPVTAQTTFSVSGEARMPRAGSITVPLVRLPAAEREGGGVAVEVLGAGEIERSEPGGLDPADPSDLGAPLAGRDTPSMVAFTFRPQPGSAARTLGVSVERYTPQAVLIANVEEARYDALVDEAGKTLVRARYAVRNNQRAFLGVTLPAGATLWSAAVGGRPLRPGLAGGGALLLPLEKGRAGEETPAFVVELTYIQRTSAWIDKGRTALTLPAVDLPVGRTGIVLHHSPRFRITPEPGAFRVESDNGPFTMTLSSDAAPTVVASPPAGVAGGRASDELASQFPKDFAFRTTAGPLPVRVPFPEFGPSVFLVSELTAELQAPSIEFSYKRESRW